MQHLSPESLKFLKDLKANNDRDWFQANKSRYEKARADFVDLIAGAIKEIGKFDERILQLNASKCVFRIYRDVRFSKNKAPYKTSMAARLIPTTTEPDRGAGYYIHIEPGNCVLAGGAYNPSKEWLQDIREEIDYDAAPLRKVIGAKSFREYFGQLEGEQLKTAPKGYAKDHPEIDLLRHKSFVAYHRFPDKLVTTPDFLTHCRKVFKAVKPLDDFLNTAMAE